jgi:DnaJ-class molecular chaperone
MGLTQNDINQLVEIIDKQKNDKNYYYQLLGVERTSSAKDIEKAYRKLAAKWHPDKTRDISYDTTEIFRKITNAKNVLIDDEKRKLYDEYGPRENDNYDKELGGGMGEDMMHNFMKQMFANSILMNWIK